MDALRIQYGKVTGDYFGDFALAVKTPRTRVADPNSIGLTMKGEGACRRTAS